MPGNREPDDGVAAVGRLNAVSLPAPPARRRQTAPLRGLVLENPLAMMDRNNSIASPLGSLLPSSSLLWAGPRSL
jgi:hypothetical protein